MAGQQSGRMLNVAAMRQPKVIDIKVALDSALLCNYSAATLHNDINLKPYWHGPLQNAPISCDLELQGPRQFISCTNASDRPQL